MLVRTRRFNLPSEGALSNVQREMEHFFGRFLQDTPTNGEGPRKWRGPIALWEDADKVSLEVELPGVKKDDIEVTVHNGMIRISGERKAPEGERNYQTNERIYGPFDHTIVLPEDVDADSVDAQLSDGVLRVVLSKRPEVQPKKVTVKD